MCGAGGGVRISDVCVRRAGGGVRIPDVCVRGIKKNKCAPPYLIASIEYFYNIRTTGTLDVLLPRVECVSVCAHNLYMHTIATMRCLLHTYIHSTHAHAHTHTHTRRARSRGAGHSRGAG